MSAHLILFAKNPIPGAVKTRLQSRYTPYQAAEVYRAFILDSLENAKGLPVDRRILAYTPPDAESDIRSLAGPNWDVLPQTGHDLGARMCDAVLKSFARDATRVVIAGTDHPSLPPSYVSEALDLLRENDVVLGPSTDGGYYLIGLSAPHEFVFQEISWGTSDVFSQTLERAKECSLGLIPVWYDVDTPHDLDFLKAHAAALTRAGRPPSLRHTRDLLSTLT